MEQQDQAGRSESGRADLAAWERAKPANYFEADENLQRVLAMHLGEAYARYVPALGRIGGLAATRMDELARLCNRDENLPVLRRWNGIGERVEQVVFNAAHHELGSLVWSSGALALLAEPGQETVAGALIHLMAHDGEAGHICPLVCTAGLIKLLQQVGTEEQRARYLPALLAADYASRLHASQFVTEIQGGSDVGALDCVARPAQGAPSPYELSGEKWFCSVADAALFVVSARVPDGPAGTAGLGLFLVPRLVDDRPNGFAIRRLKVKLGTRSMASAEIDFAGARAEPVGPLDDGFRNLVSIVLDTSRVHNALAASGLMRRACIEAQTFARFRRAFGQPLVAFPAVQAILARMRVTTAAAVATSFRLLALGDALAPRGPGDRLAARRVEVLVNKYWTSSACTDVVRSGIEVLGGNGTIEDFSVLPRLYRDAIVLESWEGTHNTLCAQLLRDFRERALHRPWLEEQRATLAALAHPALAAHQARARDLLDEVTRRIGRLLDEDVLRASAHVRLVVDRMSELSAYASLLAELNWERDRGLDGDKAALVDLYRLIAVDRVDPMETPAVAELCARLAL